MKLDTLSEFTRKKFNMGEKIQQFILKRRSKKIEKWKPGILTSMREEVENRCEKEYNDTIEKLSDEIYDLKHTLKTASKDRDIYRGKFEEYKELYDKAQIKLEKRAEEKGEIKSELESVKDDLEEALGNKPLTEDPIFQKELKSLITKCNKSDNKAELMSAFSAKWNVSLKEVTEDDKIVDYKWKEIG